MSEPASPTPLSAHTLESLIEELQSGRAVVTDDQVPFRLESKGAQAALGWYASNPTKWTRNIAKEDVEALADYIAAPPVAGTVSVAKPTAGARRTLHLKSIRAHRFAGLQRYGSTAAAPAEFFHEFDRPFTLIEGDNGAGKTSFQSAILWCLTGSVYRPQRPPEPASEPVPVYPAGTTPRGGEAPEGAASWVMSPVTPIPSGEVLNGLNTDPLPLDTWVELTFADDTGKVAGSVKRKVQKAHKNTITSTETGLAALGLDPTACAVGTRMPGLIPHIKLGSSSELGKGVAELIGIKPLLDLARHAGRMEEKFRDPFKKEREAEIRELDQTFEATKAKFQAISAEHGDLVPGATLPNPDEATAEGSLALVKQQLEARQAEMLLGAKTHLGGTFDYGNPKARQSLSDDVGPALGALDPVRISGLASEARLRRLAAVTPTELAAAEALAKDLTNEANEISQLAQKPDVASRVRLYARVAGWLRDAAKSETGPRAALDSCPVCRGALEGSLDEVTSRPVADHLEEHLATDQSFLEKTPDAWAQHALSVLRSKLPEALVAELGTDLPGHPGDLVVNALGDELFAVSCFAGCLGALKATAGELCALARSALPDFAAPAPPKLPDGFSAGEVARALERVTRAIAFARWRVTHEKARDEFVAKVLGSEAEAPPGGAGSQPLVPRLTALNRLVRNAAPIREALGVVASLNQTLTTRRAKEVRLERYQVAATAVAALSDLSRLVEGQVRALMATLSQDTARWRSELYAPSCPNAPEVVSTTVHNDGSLAFTAAAYGSEVAAQHVSNASDLRASLLAFLFAYWSHLLKTRGGLSLFLLDEPQELLDNSNRRRLANALPAFFEAAGARVVVTTSAREFGRKLASAAHRAARGRFAHHKLHPLRGVREHVVLGPFVEAVEDKRRAFEAAENENDPQPARDYIKDLRIYIENRLLDLLDSAEAGLPKQPTLNDIMGGIRGRVTNGREAYTSAAFLALASDPDLAGGSKFLGLLNESHHGHEHLITFNDVVAVKETCVRVRKLVESAHEEFEQWLRRDPREAPASMPAVPASLAMPARSVPIFADLAAFTQGGSPGEPTQEEGRFSPQKYTNHAIFALNTRNLGFAAPKDARVIVDCSDEVVSDNRLVVALHGERVLARRLHRNISSPNSIVLTSEAEDPTKRPPAQFLPAAEVRLLKIVGILFDDQPFYTKSREEAAPVSAPGVLGKVEVAFKVRGQSAMPLALPNQYVLGGASIAPNEFAGMEGHLVAVSTAEGAVFKRVGAALPGAPHVRLLEAIGGKGASMLVRVEEVRKDNYQKVPLMTSARRIVGVLYE